MQEKLYKLFNECIFELKSIGIDIIQDPNIGYIDISIAKRNAKRYGCCKHEDPDEKFKVISKRGNRKYISYEKFFKHHIEISKWVFELNDEIIKNTIMHEVIHCFPFCNNHGSEFKKYAKYINDRLGYSISRTGNKIEDYKKSNLDYKEIEEHYRYKIICTCCKQLIYRKRFNIDKIQRYRCAKCNGNLQLLKIF